MTLPEGAYNSRDIEPSILKHWLETGVYKPEYNPEKSRVESFEEMIADPRPTWALICPPPNAYGRPHIGNISGYAYMDAMARYQRMQGKKVLVLPGKDHAGLEGEGVFVREVLEKKGKFKFDMKREEFYQEMMDWMSENMKDALKDEQEIGLSADFDRNTFTLDPNVVDTVLDTFIEMYKDKRIYKGVRIVNWDPKARTAVADNQIEYQEAKTPFFYFKYNLIDQSRRVWDLSFYQKEILDAILNGGKTIEARVLNPEEPERYFGDIKPRDIINCVDKSTGVKYSFEVKDTSVYKKSEEFLENEDFSKIMPNGQKFESHDQMIEFFNTLKPNYGQKLKENGIVAIELKKFEGDTDEKAISLKKEFQGKGTLWKVQKNEKDIPYLLGEKHDGTKILGVAYDNVPVGNEVSGEVIGIQMRLDGEHRLVVKSNDFEGDIKLELEKAYESIYKMGAGSHVILFEDYKEDHFYTNGFVIGTVRPETIFADTAIVSDPKDERYKQFVGKKVKVEFLGEIKELNFIEDFVVDKDFGTGLLKETPAHSVEDWEIANRHPAECLPAIQVIGYDLRMNSLAREYAGMKIKEAREKMREDMQRSGNLVYVDDNYENKIAIAERTKAPIEPLLSSQWYLKYDGIKEGAIEMVKNKEVTIHPKAMEAKFNHWMTNLRDWAISRSLWWGYRLPVWYHGEVKEEIGTDGQVRELINRRPGDVTRPSNDGGEWIPLEYNNPDHLLVQKESPGNDWFQDEAVLDTWFSSGQWVYATLEKYNLMEKFFPTDVMVSGFDILENWISRMMMFTYFKHKEIPFKNVYLTGLVKGTDGQKMSKSKGNVLSIDQLREKYGTDAVRMVYFYQNSAGADYAMTYEKLDTFKKFINKLWNASKFVLMNLEGAEVGIVNNEGEDDHPRLRLPETKALHEHIIQTKEHITKNIENFDLGLATFNLYQAFWHEFADVHIEAVKKYTYVQKDKETGAIISEPNAEDKLEAQKVLLFALREYLKMLHPFMPFVTERIWKEVPKSQGDHEVLMYSRW
jgi:valyl-tRNA synthetase/ASC-1-like (ASCH) protein